MPPALHRLLRPAFAVLFAISTASCATDKKGEEMSPVAAAPLAPVPAPAGLLADFVLGAPEATWQKARTLIGGPAMFLPSSFGGIATTVLGLPITVAGEFDGNVPVVGALVETPGEAPHAALGLHVRVGDRLVDALTKGEGARFTVRIDPATHITHIDPKGAKGSFALGVLGNYVLVGKEAADLASVGPYVARTLSATPAPKEDLALELPAEALGGPIRARAEKLWAAIKPATEAAGPTTLIGSVVSISSGVEKLIAMLGDLRHARVTATMDPGVVRMRIVGGAKPGDGAAGKAIADLAGGDLRPILELPAGTLVAVGMRETPSARRASAPERAGRVREVLGKDLSAADCDALGKAVQGLADGRGDWATAGVRMTGTGPAAYARGAVADPDLLGKSLRDFVALAKLPSAKQRLKELELAVSAKKTTVEKVGDVERVRFERTGAAAKPAAIAKGTDGKVAPEPPQAIDFFYTVGKEVFAAAAGLDAKGALVSITSAPEGKLEGLPAMREAVEALGGDVTFGLLVEPLGVLAALAGKPGPAESAPVSLALGRTRASTDDPGAIWLRLDVANAAVQELVRRRGMF